MNAKDIRAVKKILTLAIAAAFIGWRAFSSPNQAASVSDLKASTPSGWIVVERAVDGDTLKLSDKSRIRLIGVDTPEYHGNNKSRKDAQLSKVDEQAILELGKKAYLFTKALVEGKKVRLEYDVEKRDKYKRLLAYAYLEDGTFVNAKIIEEGYGQVMTIPPNVKYAKKFRDLQRKARETGKGLWQAKDYQALER